MSTLRGLSLKKYPFSHASPSKYDISGGSSQIRDSTRAVGPKNRPETGKSGQARGPKSPKIQSPKRPEPDFFRPDYIPTSFSLRNRLPVLPTGIFQRQISQNWHFSKVSGIEILSLAFFKNLALFWHIFKC